MIVQGELVVRAELIEDWMHHIEESFPFAYHLGTNQERLGFDHTMLVLDPLLDDLSDLLLILADLKLRQIVDLEKSSESSSPHVWVGVVRG